MLAGQQLVQQHAQRKQLGARVEQKRPLGAFLRIGGPELLWRHVGERAAEAEFFAAGIGAKVEVQQHGAVSAREEYVGRLEVAVEDPLLVDARQRRGQVGAEAADAVHVTLAGDLRRGGRGAQASDLLDHSGVAGQGGGVAQVIEQVLQRGTAVVFHAGGRESFGRGVHGIDADDVRVLDAALRPGFATAGRRDLESNLAVAKLRRNRVVNS